MRAGFQRGDALRSPWYWATRGPPAAAEMMPVGRPLEDVPLRLLVESNAWSAPRSEAAKAGAADAAVAGKVGSAAVSSLEETSRSSASRLVVNSTLDWE